REAAMRFQERLLDNVRGVHAHRDPSLELPLGQAVQGRPLRLQQSAQRFLVTLTGLFRQLVGDKSFALHWGPFQEVLAPQQFSLGACARKCGRSRTEHAKVIGSCVPPHDRKAGIAGLESRFPPVEAGTPTRPESDGGENRARCQAASDLMDLSLAWKG